MAIGPKCKTCGTNHYSTQPHAGAPGLSKVATKPTKAAPRPTTPTEPSELERLGAEYAAKLAKNAAYMRDYRARAKVKK